MDLHRLFSKHEPPVGLPPFLRAVETIDGVCIMRVQGNVGRGIADEVNARVEKANQLGLFNRPLLIDFSGASGSDFSTVSYLVEAVRRRMHAHAKVGLLHAPKELKTQLEIGKVEGLFGMYENEGEAIRALAPGAS
ncbi:MAG: STAS domain-containing protein [Phycisphaeraceae bacterium]|nr:STAS domain-containing protein [Phycisphaeraceae bacterium]